MNKILLFGIAVVIIVVVGLITYGILNTTILKDSRTVAKVGKNSITVKQFTGRVKYERYRKVQTFETYASSYFASYFQTQLLSLQNQLDSYVNFGNNVLNTMIGEEALVQEAQSMGITVTDAEVEAAIQSNLNYFPNGTPTASIPTATITYFPTSTLSALQQTLTFHTTTPTAISPTETLSPILTPTLAGAENTVSGSLSHKQSAVTATGTPTKTITISPTATEYTSENYQNLYSTAIANLVTNASFSEKELRDHTRTILFEHKVYDLLAIQVAPEQDMVWARYILVPTKQQADEIEASLKKGGSWVELTAKYSIDRSNNSNSGDLGWFTKGTWDKALENVAWSLKVGSISDPVQTNNGYNIIQVLGHEKRQLSANQLTIAKNNAFSAFIESAKTRVGVKKYDIWASVIPSSPSILPQYRIVSNVTPTP